MANDVFANGREVSCKAADGKAICAFPDVCFTPPENPATPPGVPIPYPNTGMAKDTTQGSKTVKVSGKEVMLKNKSHFKKSTGDEPGSAAKKGVLTSTNRGKVYFTSWSMDVKIEGQNVVRHLDLTTHNHMSFPGNTPPWPYIDAMAAPVIETSTCPPHEWQEESRKSIEETKTDNHRKATKLRSKPSKADQARGPEFENQAIEANMDVLEIRATSVIYRCTKCGAEQEVDILGKDRIAEAKSRTKKGWKNAAPQHKNYRDIQGQVFGEGTRPLGKADNSKLTDDDQKWLNDKLNDRGLDCEIL
jgi:hypothetical protein